MNNSEKATDQPIGSGELSPIKRALLEIRELRSKLSETESELSLLQNGPIAIVGIGMRFPGGIDNAEDLWEVLEQGRNVIGVIPKDRWDWRSYYDQDHNISGTMSAIRGGFLDGVDAFDADFFGISAREAAMLDPQQRLLHEVAWHSLEDAAISFEQLRNSRTGIFLGLSNFDYYRSAFKDDLRIDAYSGSGNSPSMAAGRLAYTLGIHGPAITLDTSCSSSLAAVHLACQSLRNGECDRALAGGVNLILAPQMHIAFSRAHMLASDGQCKTFDERADGYVRSEGCAVIVLRRLEEALAQGDRVLAIIRGSAINHDGRSGGLTAPSGKAQASLLKDAYRRAGIAIDDVGMIEAHGTGTSLGDPIEMEALGEVFRGRSTSAPPIRVGSIKTNIGHCEAASGIAGLLKAILSLQNKTFPAHLNLKEKSSLIPWPSLPLEVPLRKIPWPLNPDHLNPGQSKRIAGISSFGFSGSNAHVILEEFVPLQSNLTEPRSGQPQIVTVSAQSAGALRAKLAELAEWLRNHEPAPLYDVSQTLNQGRAHYSNRRAWVVSTCRELEQTLRADDSAMDTSNGRSAFSMPPSLTFCFTGQGSERSGMGLDLLWRSEVFRSSIARMDGVLSTILDRSIRSIWANEHGELGQAFYLQPALYAYGVALSELWRSWGIEPQAVLGHSLGEYVAATVAGVMTAEEGVRLVAARGRLTNELAEPGGMLAVSAGVEEIERLLASLDLSLTLSVAAVNGPSNVVISGPLASIDKLEGYLKTTGLRHKRLRTTHGFHSAALDGMLDLFEAEASKIDYREPEMRWISNVTGEAITPQTSIDASYWRQQLRSTVQFERCVSNVNKTDETIFLEIGAEPQLLALLAANGVENNRLVASITKGDGEGEWHKLLNAAAKLYTHGVNLNWNSLNQNQSFQKLSLPLYPFERKRYWLDKGDRNNRDCFLAMEEAAQTQSSMVPIGLDVLRLAERQIAINTWATSLIFFTLQDLGCFATADQTISTEDLIGKFGVMPSHRRLLARWLNRLASDSILSEFVDKNGDLVYKATFSSLANPNQLWSLAEPLLVGDQPLRDYLLNCQKGLVPVLLGKLDPLETLFPNGDSGLATALYERSPGAVFVNRVAASAASAAVPFRSETPLGFPRRMRVLEIGAGTGSTTAAVLSILSPEKVLYTFSDVSDLFLARAKKRFRKHPMEFVLFDLDSAERLDQHRGRYDLIVIANALHAAKNLRSSLERVREVLQPGGSLLLIETTNSQAWHDVSTALIEGWQHFEDDTRTDGPLLSCEQWHRELKLVGFEHSASFPKPGEPTHDLGLHLILASLPSASDRDSLGNSESTAQIEPSVADLPAASNYASSSARRPRTETSNVVEDEDGAGNSSELRKSIEHASAKRRIDLILEYVCINISRVMGGGRVVHGNDRLMEIGVDSLMAIELRNQLQTAFGVTELPSTLIFDFPTPRAIAGSLLTKLGYDEDDLVKGFDESYSTVDESAKSVSHTDEELDAMSADDLADLIRLQLEQ